MLDRSGYLAELRASEDPQDASRVENLAELHAVATEFEQSDPEADLADFLERISLVADSDQIPSADDADGAPKVDQGVITLMTLHTAKGLEFPVVFLTGLEDGTFPHMRSLADTDQLAEERRLAYVGPHPGPPAAVHLAGRGAHVVGRAERVPGQPLPRRPARGPARLAAPRVEHGERCGPGVGYGTGFGGSGYGGVSPRSERPPTRPRSASVPPSPDAPTFGSATPRPAGDVPSLQVGDRVTHDAYGLGTVVVIEGAGPNAVAKIDFGTEGTKRLLLRYSPVTKL